MAIREHRADNAGLPTGAPDGRPPATAALELPSTPIPEIAAADETDPGPRRAQDQRERAISGIARAIAETPTLDAALEKLNALLPSLIKFDRLTVFVRHPSTDDYDRYFTRGTKIVDDQNSDLVHMDEKFFERFFRGELSKRISLKELENVQQVVGSESTGEDVGLGDCLAACLTNLDQRVGMIVLRASPPVVFTRSDAGRLNDVSSQIAGIIANSQLARLRERDLAEKLALTLIGQAVSSTLDFAEVAKRTAEALRPLVDFDRFGVAAVNESTMQATRMFRWPEVSYLPGFVDQPNWQLRGTSHQLALECRTQISIGDQNRKELSGRLPVLKRSFEAGMRSGVTTPIFHGDRIIAIASLQSSSRPSFSKGDIGLLDSVATQIGPAIVNATLHEQTAQESRRQTVLAEIGRIVSSAADISEIYDQFAKKLRELLPIDRIVIRIVDESGHTATHTYADGKNGPQGHAGSSFDIAGTTTEEVVRTRSPLILSEENRQEMKTRFPHLIGAMESGLISGISVPLITGANLIGVLHAGSTTPNSYGQREIELLEAVAAQISGAIANSRLRQQAEEQAHLRAVLAEISRVVTSSPDLESTFDGFAEEAKKIIRFDRVSVAFLDPESATLRFAYTHGAPIAGVEKGFNTPLTASVTEQAIATRTALTRSADELKEFERRSSRIQLTLDSELNSVLIAPLMWRDTTIGVLYFRSKEAHRYSDDELNIASQIAAQISGAVENSRLHIAAKEDATRQAVLGEIGRIVGSTLDIDEIYERFAATARKLIPFDRIVISLIDTDLDTVTDAYVAGMESAATPLGFTDRLSDTIVMDLVEDRKTRIYSESDLLAEPRQAGALRDDLRSLLLVPLCWGDNVIGTLNFRSAAPAAYDAKLAGFAEQIGAQIAGAIAIAGLHAQTRRDASKQATLAEIGRIISSSPDLEDIYERFAEQVGKLIECDRIAINLIDEQTNRLKAIYSSGVEVAGGYLEYGHDVTGTPMARVLQQNEALTLNEEGLQRIAQSVPLAQHILDTGLRSILAVPLVWRGSAIGTLVLRSKNPEAYPPESIETAGQIAVQIAGAVANAGLHAQTRRDARRQAALAEIGRVVSSSLDRTDIFQRLAGKAREIIPFDRLVVTLLDSDRDLIEIAYVEGLAVESAGLGAIMPLEGTPLAEAARTLRPEVISVVDIDNEAGSPDGVASRAAAGLNSHLIAPLIWHNEAIGFLTFESRDETPYSDEKCQVAVQIAVQISGAIANADLHARSIQLAIEREARIKLDAENRELQEIEQDRGRFISTISHELRTPLTSISAFSDLLARNKKGHLDERELQQIGLVKKNAQRLNTLINDLFDVTKINAGSFELHLEEFDVRQLLQELSESLSPMFAEKGQKLIVSLPDHDVWVNADRDRIAQVISNLLSNASKYSHRDSQIDLVLRAKAGQVCIRVRDQGIGISRRDRRRLFTPFFRADNEETRKVAGTGLGLVVTKSIVEMHGGTINLTSTPGKGSCFEVEIPEARHGPSPTHIEKMAKADMPLEPISRLDALDPDPAATAPES